MRFWLVSLATTGTVVGVNDWEAQLPVRHDGSVEVVAVEQNATRR